MTWGWKSLQNTTKGTAPSVFLKEDKIFGKSFGHWITKYWQTFYYDDEKRSRSDVYMLPGFMPDKPEYNAEHAMFIDKEPQKQEQTDYTVSQDKAILLSPMNYIVAVHMDDVHKDHTLHSRIKRLCKDRMDAITEINLSLDGKSVSQYIARATSEKIFEADIVYDAFSDGFWLLLKRGVLEKGVHRIESFSSCTSGQTQLPLEYNLTIV